MSVLLLVLMLVGRAALMLVAKESAESSRLWNGTSKYFCTPPQRWYCSAECHKSQHGRCTEGSRGLAHHGDFACHGETFDAHRQKVPPVSLDSCQPYTKNCNYIGMVHASRKSESRSDLWWLE